MDSYNSTFWTTDIEGVSCIFPKFVHASEAQAPYSPTVGKVDVELLCSTRGFERAGIHLSAWAILLGQYLGAEQVCFGVVQELPLESKIDSSKTKHSSLQFSSCRFQIENERKASAVVLGCEEWLETCRPHLLSPAPQLYQQIGPPGQPQFNTAFFLVGPEEDFNVDFEGFELALIVRRSESSGLKSCHLQFSSSLLPHSAAVLIATNYQTIISDLVANLDLPIGHLCKLSKEDLEKTWSWNRACPAPVNGLLHDMFRSKVLSHPEAPAICGSDASFTYQELDVVSNVLAHFLVQEGVGPETVVPLCFNKSAWATVAMLGVTKAGGAFTFLDPSFPMENLEDIIRQVDARFLLCSTACLALWNDRFPAYEVSAEAVAALPQLNDAPKTSMTPSGMLYLIFTSGSSGKPKGVCIEHSGYLSTALSFIRATGMSSSNRVLHFGSYSFDVVIFEIYTTLICGGCVCIPDEASRDKGFAHFMDEFNVTWAFFTPSLIKWVKPEDVPSLKTLVLLGEAPAQADIERWAGKVRLMNAYGPSECSAASAVHPSLNTGTEAANIGWPLGGRLWVVDASNHNQLVPVGAVGELAIEGPHLGRGYLQDNIKTAKAFVDSLEWTAGFPVSRSRRVYLTGDIVRRHMDGSIVFIGRKDTQVKIRGMRVELSAVEQHLSADRRVSLAVAVVPKTGERKNRLTAVVSITDMKRAESNGNLKVFKFVNPRTGLEQVRESIRDIRDCLGQKMPGHMVPSAWIVLESFPLMPSGKIDRGKVKEWIEGIDATTLEESECFPDQVIAEDTTDEKLSPLEEEIRRIIGLVLNLPLGSIALSKSFISLGGDSISALQLKSQCHAQNIIVNVHDILRSKSITKLALCAKPHNGQVGVLQPDAQYNFDVPFGLSPIQKLFFQWEPEGTHAGGANRFNQSFWLRVKRPVSLSSMAAALGIMVERHPMLRCRFVKSSPSSGQGITWQQIIPKETSNSFHLEEHRASGSDEIRGVILRSQCAINMLCGLVFIVDLINGPHDQFLSMIAHHLVIDLVSWRIIMRELELVLQGGEVIILPPQTSLPWPAWCRLQADYANQHLSPKIAFPQYEKIQAPDLGYWGMENVDNKFGDTIKQVILLDSATTSLLMGPERHQVIRTEPVDLILSAMIHSFSQTFPDRRAPTIFRESHGREPWDDAFDISSTVGWFTTIYPVQLEEGCIGVINTLRCVKDAQRRVPRNGWPYFASRFYNPDGIKEFGSPSILEVIFDFLGLYQQLERSEGLFEQASWDNHDVGPEFHRPSLFEITAEVIQGRLQLKFEYNKTMKRQDDIVRWTQECEKDLSRIVSELGRIEAESRYVYTLSDFPLLQMGYSGLDKLFTSVLPQLRVSVDAIEEVYDTSPMQTGLLLSQAKDNSLYQCSLVFLVDTTSSIAVDVQRLSDTWLSLVQRHSSLRTIFIPDVSNSGAFCQVVLKKTDPRIVRICCYVSELDVVLKEPTYLPLQDGLPPHKLTICEVSDGRVYIRIDINHACIDGASGDILVRDFISLYDGSIQLPQAPVYRDFVSQVQRHDLEKGLQYWVDCLKNVEPCHLPVLDDGVAQDGSLQMIQAKLTVSIDSLSRFCQAYNITLPTIFKLAWSLVLRAYTGSNTACFGYLVSGRDNLETEGRIKQNAIGAFVNILTCRCDLSDTLGSVLNRIHEDSLNDLQHQYCSIAHIQRSLSPQKPTSQQPLFNTILNFQVHPVTECGGSSITLNVVHTYEPTEYSCVVDIAVTGQRLEASFTYWTSSLCRGQAENVATAFSTALESLIRSPEDTPAKNIGIFGENHDKKVWAWNHTLPPRVDMCIHDALSRNATAYPSAMAVESWDADYTYKQLDEITTKAAYHLAHLGVRAGSIVPLYFERSSLAIISLMAVLKAGGAFLLLDPKHVSAERTAGIIQDTRSSIIIAGERESMRLDSIVDIPTVDIIVVDSKWAIQIASCSNCLAHQQPQDQQQGRRSGSSSQDPAFVLFTSATTGKPKGSVTSHSAFCTAAAGFARRTGLSRRSRLLQYASYTFDASVAEILFSLHVGGCVCVPSEKNRTEYLADVINESRVNFALLTPSVARLIAPTEVPALETLVLCGEAMSKADALRWYEHLKLINAYGPSECSIWTTMNHCVMGDPTNIGKPESSLCWVVDPKDHECLMPVGAIGEMIIEGHTVANGYINNEAKTADAFIEPPGWLREKRSDSGQALNRLYKTGDLVRYNSDGSIKFIGRKDTQSKIHGQRIELSEIEQHILSQLSIIRTVAVEVIAPEARKCSPVLAAFFKLPMIGEEEVLDDHDDNIFSDLPNDLAAQLQSLQISLTNVLPSYMIPTLFIPLLTFPLSPSGKLDRKSLRRAAAKLPAAQLYQYSLTGVTCRQELQNEAEEILQKVWIEVLGAPAEMISRDSNFFRLGGDSLSAMRLVSTARNKYGFIIAVADIFQRPRLCDMADNMKGHGQKSAINQPAAAIEAFALLERDKPVDWFKSMAAAQCQVRQERILDLYPCTPLQEGLMAISVERKGAYLMQSVFLLPETLDIDRLKRAFEVVVNAHPILRTRIVNIEAAGCLQVVLDDPVTWLHPTCSKEQYLADDLDTFISWGSPLHRLAVLVGANLEPTYLVWTAHHALFDEWSQGLIFEHLEKIYHEEAAPTILPFNHFIEYITKNNNDEACAAFWADQLGGNTPATLPQLLPNGYISKTGDIHELVIDLAREEGSHITTPSILRAAWALVTGRYAYAEDVVFGASVSGRSSAAQGIDKINGPTMATVPVKVHLGRELPISGFLEDIQAQAAKMIAFEHWGLQNMARVSNNMAFQNLFVMHLPTEKSKTTPLGLTKVGSPHAGYHIYALIVECFMEEDDRQVRVRMSYDAQVIPYASRLGSHFEWLIQQLILRVDDDSPLRTLDFCSAEDKACIFDWNLESPRIVDDCIHDIINMNTKRRPDAPAICAWDFSLTYAQLDIMSTKLARHLVYLGVKTERIVPAIFEKSAWAVVAQLAVLKAGGVMCMLDPGHPRQRLEDHIDTTHASFLLSSETYLTLLKQDGRVILPLGASTMQSITEDQCAATLPTVRPENAAYVVFTSGTTGRPKGSITEHRAFASCSASFATAMQISETARVLQHAAFSFDPYIVETFSTLTQGGCVCIAKDDVRTNLLELVEAISTLEVTWAMMTPSAGRLLPRNGVPTLKTLMLCGEAMSQMDRTWSDTVRLMNVYGPSECSVVSALNDNVTLDSDNTAIGKGVGSRCWITEPHDHNLLAPVGCVGELLLESPGLARGYLNEPVKTEQAFIHGPAWLQGIRPNSRMYKTGDLVRYHPVDGLISFVGRKDMQLKVHGQRLEPDEIEHHLMAHEYVRTAAVTHPKAGKFKNKLVATLSLSFMTTTGKAGDSRSAKFRLVDYFDKPTAARQLREIKAKLEGQVPAYMVPSVWAVVYGVPLTASLKVGKRETATWLENLDDDTADEIMGFSIAEEEVGGENVELEQQLRDIVAKVLGLLIDQVLPGRSFMSLGGDSITAIQVMARCRSEHIDVSIKDILQSNSILQLAKRATTIDGDRNRFSPSTNQEFVGTEFALTPIQRLYFEAGLGQIREQSSLGGSSHFNQSILIQLPQEITVKELSRTVQAIVEQHGMLRARFTHNEINGIWTQRIIPTAEVVSSVFRHHTVASLSDINPIIADSQSGLDAIGGAVFTADFFSIGVAPSSISPGDQPQQQLLFMAAHHLVVDLVSWRIIVQDMEEFLATGKLLSRDVLSFQTWAEMQESYVDQTPQNPKELADLFKVAIADCQFWGISPDTNIFGETLNVGFALDAEPTSALLDKCNHCFGTKAEDLFISALLASFACVFPDRDIPPVYCEGHGRECAWDSAIDLSSTVGWFTVLYPLQVQLAPSQKGLIDSVRRTKDARVRASGRAWSYFASRFMTRDGQAAFKGQWPMEILFNYVGGHQKLERDDTLLVPVSRSSMPQSSNHDLEGAMVPITTDVGVQCRRMALFDINVEVDGDDRANFTFFFNRRTLHQSEIQLWISKYHEFLLEIVDQLVDMVPEPTLSDFPLMSHLTYEHLDQIKAEMIPALSLSNLGDIEDMYPCGPAQRGILISQARSTDSYNETFFYAVSSMGSEPVDLERLEMAWRKVVARHDVLRTVTVEDTFATGEGFYQVVLRHWCPRIRTVNYINGDNDISLEKMRRLSDTDATVNEVYASKKMEPAHSMVFCRTATTIYMYLEISHALIDAFSIPVLLKDIAAAYDSNPLGPEDEKKYPTYGDYIAHIKGLPMEDAIDYWTRYLDGMLPCHIPALKEESTHPQDFSGVQSVPITLNISSESVLDFCLQHGLTPSSIFTVAWALVLRAYTGMDEVCFGYLVSGRDAQVEGIENIIGIVCNMLIFRINLNRAKTGIQLLLDAQDSWVNSVKHQFVSLADVQHQHHQKRVETPVSTTSSHFEALFNTGVSFFGQNAGRWGREAKSSKASLVFDALGGNESSEYAAAVTIWPTADNSGFHASYNYKASHMSAAQAKNLAKTFAKAVQCIMELSASPLNEWCLITESDVNNQRVSCRLNIKSNSSVSTYVDEQISAISKQKPDRPAICSWDGQLSYQDLETMSTQLAHHLSINHGVGPEVLVPVCMEKSLWFVVSILAVLKAGGAFVPMDATQPARFQAIIEQTDAQLVLISEALRERMSHQNAQITALVIDRQLMKLLSPVSSQYIHHMLSYRQPENAAYVMFTSGSTGTPKGVVVEHRAWCASATGWIKERGIDDQTRVLQFASYSFDVAIGEILGSLMAGACLCIPSEAERLDNLEKAITRMQVELLNIPPSVVKILEPENIPSVRTIVLGGESTPEYEIRRWYSHVRLVTAYGPTECSVETSAVAIQHLDAIRTSNIGVPRDICRYWIVSATDHNVLVPAGSIGELLIEGAILARGYLNDPARTTVAFITNPIWAVRRANEIRRMYKTGDLVQLTEDGSYRYVGRKDRQVKIRGQRIELGEVEHHVHRALGGKYPVAVESIEMANDTRLVAFAAIGEGEDDTSIGMNLQLTASTFDRKHQVRAAVAAASPSYMVPTAVIPLRQLPLLSSHKIDRQQLRQIASGLLTENTGPESFNMRSRNEPFNSSNNPELSSVQRQMRELWGEILNKDAAMVTLEDSFLDQGGDSILAIKLVSACRSAGLVISVADVLRQQDLAALCQPLEEVNKVKVKANLRLKIHEPLSSLGSLATPQFVEDFICPQVGVSAEGIQDIVEASPSQTNFIESSILRGRGSTNYFAFHLTGRIDEARIQAACQSLVVKHPILRTSFVPFKRRVFQVVLRSMIPEFRAYRCPELQQEQFATRWVEEDQAEAVILGQPILRFLFLGSESRSLLVMRISHAQYDGMAIDILTNDLAGLYQGQAIPDRPAFLDFVYAARESNEQGAEAYWRTLLAGATMTNVVCHKSPPYQSAKSQTISKLIATPQKGAHGFTFATILKASWALVLAKLSSSTDVVFGHVISGRNMSVDGLDVDKVLGPCLNLIPVRVQLQGPGTPRGARTIGDLLRLVHDQQVAAIPFETFGADKMVERLTDWSPWTRFSTVVQYQNLDGRLEGLEDFGFGDARCRLSAFQGQFDPADILVLATPKEGGRYTDVALTVGSRGQEGGLSYDFVSHLLDSLLVNIELLSSTPWHSEKQLSSFILQSEPQIPLLVQRSSTDCTAAAAASGYSFKSMPVKIKDIINQAWESIMGPLQDQNDCTFSSQMNEATPFYDIWGNLIAAAQFADFYSRHGVHVSVEDIIEHPSMLAQSILLARHMHVSIRPNPPSLLLLIFPIQTPWWISVQ